MTSGASTELGPNPLAAGEQNISVAEARAAIHASLKAIADTQTVALAAASGRVLAADVISPIDVPAHDNAAMDGYAFAGAALRPGRTLSLRSVGPTILAGQPAARELGDGDCVRIMTGAVMPGGLDTVVPIELCQVDGDQVSIPPDVIRTGENRRRRGEDLAAGRPALRTGSVLRPADIGLAASLGLTELAVRRPLRVAVFSTGDEVQPPGQPLAPNCIYDSNRFALIAALQRLGMEPVDLGLVRDDPLALRAVLAQATTRADAVVTSGGVSAGDADYVRGVLDELGQVTFWKVAMRPGRPFAFGPLRAGDQRTTWLFALPGNPVAALVTFYVFAREALLELAGAAPRPLPVLQARSTSALRKRPGRTEYQRGIVRLGDDGQWQVERIQSQGAGVLRSMSEANALIVLGHDQGSVAAGDPVDVWLFDGLV